MSKLRILLAEDHDLVRAGIVSLLDGRDDMKVVAQARDGAEALRLARETRPDVAVLDVKMERMNGLEAAQKLTQELPLVHIIMLSVYSEEEYVLQAMRSGARGYLLKHASPRELVQAVQAVARGDFYLSQEVSRHVLADYVRQLGREAVSQTGGTGTGAARPRTPDPRLAQLTPRQREVLEHIARGYSTQEIANKLFISAKTVDSHRAQIMERLDIREIAGLIRYAFQNGLVPIEE